MKTLGAMMSCGGEPGFGAASRPEMARLGGHGSSAGNGGRE